MMKTKIYIVVILFCLIGAGLPMTKARPQNINEAVSGPLPEYVNLMTDRNLYIAGETIWFSASCMLKDGSGPSPISQVIYIELYNIAQKTFVQEKFKLTNGRVTGDIQIPEELPSAHYFLRAYTMFMRNYPPESYFTTSLTIMNTESPWVNQDTINEIRVFTQEDKLIPGIDN
ncbi:MAG: hypothetical protein IH594_19075, partial [Bacteroidales bacterium]|nr:hypothetical protein [Bacteroidales bacterium]